jgi:hypothetical protein
MNGRVDIKTPSTSSLFNLYDKIPANQCVTFRNPNEGIWDNTELSTAYFSSDNIQNLQNGIRNGVYNKSNGQYTIGNQDCDTLKIIMKSIFLQNAENRPDDIHGQIRKLNKLVLNYCINQVYSEAKGYMKYIDDVSTLAVPLSHPVMETTEIVIEQKPWF